MDQCSMYNISEPNKTRFIEHYEQSMINVSMFNTIKCVKGHFFDGKGYTSVVTQFELVCEKSWLQPFGISLYMFEKALSSLLGGLSDRYGRRIIFLIDMQLRFVALGICALSNSFVSYGIGMLLVGVFSNGFVLAFIICMFCFAAYAIGYVISAIIGYLLPNWRWLLGVNALIGILFIPYAWVIPESPRWLLARGRNEEAIQVLQEVARVNNVQVDVKSLLESGITLNEKENDIKSDKSMNILTLLRNGILLKRFITMCYIWFVTSLLYYTIGLNTSGLAGNRFTNCLFVAAVEIPAYTLGFIFTKYVSRPLSLSVMMTISGACCTIAPFLSSIHVSLTVAVAMLGKFMITSTYFIIYIYFAELWPTLLRNFSVGIAVFHSRIGGILAPYLIYAGEKIHERTPFIIIGSLAIFGALFTIAFLPETKGVTLPETVDDILANNRYIRPCEQKEKTTR